MYLSLTCSCNDIHDSSWFDRPAIAFVRRRRFESIAVYLEFVIVNNSTHVNNNFVDTF